MDANGLVVMPGMGPAWKMTPGRSSTLKLRNDETEESVMMFEEVAPIGTVTPMHLHHDSDEVAYVLSGEITFKIGDTVTVGGPGTCAFMPRDVAHAWKISWQVRSSRASSPISGRTSQTLGAWPSATLTRSSVVDVQLIPETISRRTRSK